MFRDVYNSYGEMGELPAHLANLSVLCWLAQNKLLTEAPTTVSHPSGDQQPSNSTTRESETSIKEAVVIKCPLVRGKSPRGKYRGAAAEAQWVKSVISIVWAHKPSMKSEDTRSQP